MHDEFDAALRVAPAAAGAMWSWMGFSLNEMVAWCTLIYISLQIGLLVPRYWALVQTRRWEDRP